MRHARRFALAVVALAMLFTSSLARAQVLQLVPTDAMVVIKIKNLQDVSTKIATLSQQWGLANIRPELNDPLGTLLTVGGLGPGLNKNGEAAIAIMKPAQGGGEPDVVVLVPVTDFKAFSGALPNVKKPDDAGAKKDEPIEFNPGGKPVYTTSVGQFAAVSPNKDLLSAKGRGLQATGAASKELAAKDLVAYINLKAVRAEILPPLQQNKQQMIDGIGQAMAQVPGANPKFTPVLKTYLGQFVNAAEEFLKDADGATFGINLSKEGISTTLMAEFEPGSYLGKLVSGAKNSDASFTKGLPDGKYFMYGGFVIDQSSMTLFNDFVAPIEKQLQGMGADGKALLDYLGAAREYMSAARQGNFGMVAPPAAAIGQQQGILQIVSVVHGDAAKMTAAQRRMLQSQDEIMKLTGAASGISGKTTFAQDAKTVDGVKLDQFTTKFAVNPKTPQEQQAAFMMQMMYGPNGMNGYAGSIGNDKMVGLVGGNEALLTSVVQAAKSDNDTLSKGPAASVIKALPQNHRGAVFVPIDTIASTVLDVMAARGMPGGVKLPPNLPPLGAAIATEGTSVRVEGYIPAQTVQALIAAGMQMWLQNMQGGGAGQPGGL
jgi:hypothetical protein